jgi:hypothetical protein
MFENGELERDADGHGVLEVIFYTNKKTARDMMRYYDRHYKPRVVVVKLKIEVVK